MARGKTLPSTDKADLLFSTGIQNICKINGPHVTTSLYIFNLGQEREITQTSCNIVPKKVQN